MNKIIIALLIIIILLVLNLAWSYFNLDYLIRDPTSLNIGGGTTGSGSEKAVSGATMGTISAKSLDSPTSTRYNYSGWFFINSNFTLKDKDNVLFNREKDFIVALNGSTLKIYAGDTGPTVNDSNLAIGTIAPGSTNNLLISIPNFPFQKWAYLVINVDGTTVDVYIDGKFVMSSNAAAAILSNGSHPITYGNQYTQGSFCRFSRQATTINPQKVWQQYMQGSGQGMSFSSTGVKVDLLKNGQTKITQKIF